MKVRASIVKREDVDVSENDIVEAYEKLVLEAIKKEGLKVKEHKHYHTVSGFYHDARYTIREDEMGSWFLMEECGHRTYSWNKIRPASKEEVEIWRSYMTLMNYVDKIVKEK